MLPFLTPPAALRTRRIGDARCGVIEVEERGGLTVAEDAAIAELLAEGDSAFVEAAKAADAIATAESSQPAPQAEGEAVEDSEAGQLSIVEAFEIIKRAISGEDLEPAAMAIRLRHAELIQGVAVVFARSGQRNMEAGVTALIRSRLNRPAWSLDDTRRMDRVLFQGLNQLVLDEQAAEKQVDEPVSDEEVGKPRAASGNGRRRTGRKSSGSSATHSPVSSDAAPSPVS